MPGQANIHVKVTMTGRAPGMLLHSSELADETNKFAMEIREIIDQGRGRKQLTDEQRERKNWLQWHGAIGTLYWDDEQRYLKMPANNLFRAVVIAATDYRLGTKISERGAVSFEAPDFPILRGDGKYHDDLDVMYKDSRYRLRIPVNPNPSGSKKSLVPVMRPVLPEWSGEIGALVLPELINWEDFLKVIQSAGNVGIGNGRKIGYGRFDVAVERLK